MSENDVIVPAVQQVKIYLNDAGDIVLSRSLEDWERHSADQNSETFIVIPKLYVPRLIERMRELLAEGS